MKRVVILCLGSAFVLLLLRAGNAVPIPGTALDEAAAAARGAAHNPGRTIVVNSTADSGPGTLRQALLDAESGDTTTFDPSVFRPAAPATIVLTGGLPELNQGNLTIDGSSAGVILDGSNIGITPETVLLDDISLTLNGGPNLIANGDFSAGLGHWRPWDKTPGPTRDLNNSDFHSSPSSYAWSVVAHDRNDRTVYDTLDTIEPFDDWPYQADSTVWLPALDGGTAELRFWYKNGLVTAGVYALFQDGRAELIGEWWFDWQNNWTEAIAILSVPTNAVAVALEFHCYHPETFSNGLLITSNGNTVWGLQIVNFPDNGISLFGGAGGNTIGGDQLIGLNPLGRGNLISDNGCSGIEILGPGTSANTITGNHIGTDITGMNSLGNHCSGVRIGDGASHNVVGPNNIIAHNADNGVDVSGADSLYNTIVQNSIHSNTGMGIALSGGGNAELTTPFISVFDLDTGLVMGYACANCIVEVFSDSNDEGGVYEGRAEADGADRFVFGKGTSLVGPHLTATATDAGGNTSAFSIPTLGTGGALTLQNGNRSPINPLLPREPKELEDNRVGGSIGNWEWGRGQYNTEVYENLLLRIRDLGIKWVRTNFWSPNPLNWQEVLREPWVHSIPQDADDFITDLVDNRVNVVLTLSAGAGLFGHEDGCWGGSGWGVLGDAEPDGWFKTQEEREKFIDYARFMAQHFKGRVEYYEIWNEPNDGKDVTGGCNGGIALNDYVTLVQQVAPVIRNTDPEAKIVAGAVAEFGEEKRQWLLTMLSSGLASVVDAISWHPFYGESPVPPTECTHLDPFYWRDYPANVQSFQQQAASIGFDGEYMVGEMVWRTPTDFVPQECPSYSDVVAAKYAGRANIIHLGMDFAAASNQMLMPDVIKLLPRYYTIRNLSAVMAGAVTANVPFSLLSATTETMSYTFSLPSGGHLIALWNDGVAVDDNPGIPGTLTIPVYAEHTAVGIDVLHGFQQQLVTDIEDGNLVIRDLLIKDYPLILWLYKPRCVFLPGILKGAAGGEVGR